MCLIRTRDFVAFLSNYGQLERAGTFHVALGWKSLPTSALVHYEKFPVYGTLNIWH